MTNSRNTNYSAASTPTAMRRGTNRNNPIENKNDRKTNSSARNSNDKPTKWVQIRLIPIWLRVLIVIILLFVAVIAGLTVGYSVLGDGEPSEAFKWSTWQHIVDIIKGKE